MSARIPPTPSPPTWVRKRDGRLVPFDPDRISQTLFRLAEQTERADPFLTRELADVVLHFLSEEADGQAVSTAQIGEVIIKVLRELKQYPLATAYLQQTEADTLLTIPPEVLAAEGVLRFSLSDSPTQVHAACQRQYALQALFTRDLAAAHEDGILTLHGLRAPASLAACLVPLNGDREEGRRELTYLPWPHLVERLADCPAEWAIVDGFEHLLARTSPQRPKRGANRWTEQAATALVDNLVLGLRLSQRTAIVNLNAHSAPPWADEQLGGPLFASLARPIDPDWLHELALSLVEACCRLSPRPLPLRVDWHVGEHDFTTAKAERLASVVRLALDGQPITFVLDRPRRPLLLAEGVSRRQPGVLLQVDLALPRLAALTLEQQPHTAMPWTGDWQEHPAARLFLDRLKSLARLALSAGLQKREFLRRFADETPGLARGFLLERARLLVVPVGLDHAVQAVLGSGMCQREASQAFGCAIVERLQTILQKEGRASALESTLDSSLGESLCTQLEPSAADIPGLTCWDSTALPRSQLQTIGALHSQGEAGTGFLVPEADTLPSVQQVMDWLRWAWKETSICRLQLAQRQVSSQQMSFQEN